MNGDQFDLNKLKCMDEEEWEKTFPILWPQAYRASIHLLLTDEDCEDVVMTAFNDLIALVHRVRGSEEVVPLLVLLVRRRRCDLIRKMLAKLRDRRRTGPLVDDLPEPEQREDRLREIIESFLHCLEKCGIGEKSQLIIKDHIFGGLSREELAAKYGESPSSIGVIIHRVRKKTFKCLWNQLIG
jgi:RNA polymerase sigma factor (sigma-70 family)